MEVAADYSRGCWNCLKKWSQLRKKSDLKVVGFRFLSSANRALFFKKKKIVFFHIVLCTCGHVGWGRLRSRGKHLAFERGVIMPFSDYWRIEAMLLPVLMARVHNQVGRLRGLDQVVVEVVEAALALAGNLGDGGQSTTVGGLHDRVRAGRYCLLLRWRLLRWLRLSGDFDRAATSGFRPRPDFSSGGEDALPNLGRCWRRHLAVWGRRGHIGAEGARVLLAT